MKGILLDIDGTLVLSNDAHAEAWVKAFAHFGYTIDYEDVRPLIGMGGDKLMPKLIPKLESDTDKASEISSYRGELFRNEYAGKLKPAPGSRQLVQKLQERGLKLLVATSAKAEELNALLKAAQVDDLLKHATTSDDAENSKPDPDIVHAALDKIGLTPPEVIMIGDTPYDIEAAGRAGVQLIAVRCGGWADKDLTGSVAIYDNPADILINFDSSPLH